MTRLIVNNEDVGLESGAKTWGELLIELDGTCRTQGRVVTAARLDGVEEPSFREAELALRPLSSIAVVEIDIETPAALLGEAIREASTGLAQLCGHAVRVGRDFRGLDITAAQHGLVDLVQGLQVLTSLVATIGAVLRTDLGAMTWEGQSMGTILDGLGAHLEALIDAQQRQDWLTVADVIEYDIAPALEACKPVFAALSVAGQRH